MPWGTDRESQLKKHATQTLVLWGDGVKEKGGALGLRFEEITAMEVVTLVEALGLRLATAGAPADKIVDEIRSMLFDWVKQLREHAREEYKINLEPH